MQYAKDFNDLFTSQTPTACSICNMTYEATAEPSLTKAERALSQLTDKIIAYDELVTRLNDLEHELEDDGVFAMSPRLADAFRNMQSTAVSKLQQWSWGNTPSITKYKEDVYYKTWWNTYADLKAANAFPDTADISTDFAHGTIGAGILMQADTKLRDATTTWLQWVQDMSQTLDKEIAYLTKRISKYQKADTNIYERGF